MSRLVELGEAREGEARAVRPSRRPLLRVGSAVLAVVLFGLILANALTQDRYRVEWLIFASNVAVAATTIVAGQVGWAMRPESRVGPLLVVAGLLHLGWKLEFTDWSLTFTLGLLLDRNFMAVLGHALLTFPTGRTASRAERALIVGLYAVGILGSSLIALFEDPTGICDGCPRNLALITDAPSLVDALLLTARFATVILGVPIVLFMMRKWRRGSAAARRALAPVVTMVAVIFLFTLLEHAGQLWFPSVVDATPWFWLNQVVIVLVPLGFLAGLLRTRMGRSAVGELVVELGRGAQPPGGLREALARRLGDPSLQIAYFRPERGDYVDERGHPMNLRVVGSGRAVTLLESAGEPIAALVHDEFLRHDPEIVEAVAAAARLAISNERLRAEVRAQLEEVRASRARIVEAGDAGRRRVERNLHDGAQQRLVTLSLAVGMLLEELDHDGDPEIVAQLDAISEDVRQTIEELRELGRGFHPAILAEEGLSAGVESLAERSPVPVSIDGPPIDRLPEPVEVAAYFVVAEALTNVAKYSHAKHVTVRISRRGRLLEVDVVDDGVGGADPTGGSGLRGLEDRVAAIGGELRLESRAGGGTRVHAEIPCDGR